MTNPFDDPNSSYLVLVNRESRHCLWPASADVPPGWSAVNGPADRAGCLQYVTDHWADIRPGSLPGRLRARMPAERGAGRPAGQPAGK